MLVIPHQTLNLSEINLQYFKGELRDLFVVLKYKLRNFVNVKFECNDHFLNLLHHHV